MANGLHALHALPISISHAREGGLPIRNKYRKSVKSVKLVKACGGGKTTGRNALDREAGCD
jgi:hypothetical protein